MLKTLDFKGFFLIFFDRCNNNYANKIFMINKFKLNFKNKNEIFALGLLIIVTIISTTYYNYTKNNIIKNYENVINNVYFKKTVNHLLNNLEPKFKKITHQIKPGETFDSILNQYSVNKEEITDIKNKLSEKTNLNKLNVNQKVYLKIDQSNNMVKDFIFQISNKERIILTRDVENNNFNQKILLTRLNKKILYKENIILNSLYKSATDQKIPVNTIIEFARIYGFQVDFQRNIRKKERFQIMYEVFIDEKKKNY